MKKIFIKALCVICAVAMLASVGVSTVSAADYKTGANSASPSYMSGKYYSNLMRIPLTGDGVTDVLAVALSQLGYSESSSNSALSGVTNGSGNHTEYNWNIGDIEGDGYEMEWCAAFCSWSLLQSGCTTHNSWNDSCRKHPNDPNYIWREVGCPPWVTSLKNAGLYSLRGAYTPKSGDLIFFNRGNTVGHIGLVVWCDGSRVYTIEGNTSDSAGIEGNGGGVYYKSYSLSNTGINGYGRLPYKSNPNVPKVDYSGNNKTAGLYMTKAAFKVSPPVDAGHPFYEEVYTIPKYEMFEVTGFTKGTDGVDYAVVKHGEGTYYGKLNGNTLQITAGEQVHVCSFHFTYTHDTHMDRCDECGAEKNYVPHEYSLAYDDTQHYLQCWCGYKKPKSYGTHTYNTYSADTTNHVKACSCGRPDPSATSVQHDFSIKLSDDRYACECGAERQNGVVHFHEYGFTYDATHHMDRCECGARINEVEHDFQPAYDDKEHFLQCSCGYKKPKSYGKHEIVYIQTESGHAKGCSDCEYVVPDSQAGHAYGFTYDATHHMDRCECDSRVNVVEHSYRPAFDDKEHYLQCSCGYKKPRSYGTHEYTTLVATESGHVKACECGKTDPNAEQVAHNFNIVGPENSYICECGAIYQSNGSVHIHKYGFTYTHETHMDRCDECGAEKNYVPHDYKLTHNDTQHYLQCWCGYKKPKSYVDHAYNTYLVEDDTHVKACECGLVDSSDTPSAHEYEYVCNNGASSLHECVCKICKFSYAENHVFNLNNNTECICGEKNTDRPDTPFESDTVDSEEKETVDEETEAGTNDLESSDDSEIESDIENNETGDIGTDEISTDESAETGELNTDESDIEETDADETGADELDTDEFSTEEPDAEESDTDTEESESDEESPEEEPDGLFEIIIDFIFGIIDAIVDFLIPDAWMKK